MSLLIAALLVLVACVQSDERHSDSADLRDPWSLAAVPGDRVRAAGRQIYASCASCHLADGAGRSDGTIPRLAGQQAAFLERRLGDLADGTIDLPVMTPFARALSGAEIHQVSAYLSSLPQPKWIDVDRGRRSEHGESRYAELCQSCHGPDALGLPALNTPRLCGQHEAYLLRRLNEMANPNGPTRRGVDPAMQVVATNLPTEDRRAVSQHLAGLECD